MNRTTPHANKSEKTDFAICRSFLNGCGFITGHQTGLTSNLSPARQPTFISVSPTALDSAGGQTLILTGTGFDSSMAISINGMLCSQMRVLTPTSASCVSPAQSVVTSLNAVLSLDSAFSGHKLLRSYTPLGQLSATSIMQLEHGLFYPGVMRNCGERVALLDATNNRILIWNQMPPTQFVTPDYVLGQNDLSTAEANLGGTQTASNMQPGGFTCTATKPALS